MIQILHFKLSKIAKLYQEDIAIIWYLIAYYAKMLESLKSSLTALERGILGMCGISKCEFNNLNFTGSWIFIIFLVLLFFFFQFERIKIAFLIFLLLSYFPPTFRSLKGTFIAVLLFVILQLFMLLIYSSMLWSVLVWLLRLGGWVKCIGPLSFG